MWLQWAAKELTIASAVKYTSSGGLKISHVQPTPTQLVLGMLKPIASGILLYIIVVITISAAIHLTGKARNTSRIVTTKVRVA